jgi:hypothetical protein
MCETFGDANDTTRADMRGTGGGVACGAGAAL